ncbi:MAG: hypothetical protein WAV00_18560 [Nocardioides sp.]
MDNFRIVPIPFTGTLCYFLMALWFAPGGNPAGYFRIAVNIALAVALNVWFAAWLPPRQTGGAWWKWMWLPLSAIPMLWWVVNFVI